MMRRPSLAGLFALGLVAACGGLIADVPDGDATDGGVSSADAATTSDLDGSRVPSTDSAAAADVAPADASADTGRDSMVDAVADAAVDAPTDAGLVETVVSLSTGSRTCFATSFGRLFCNAAGATFVAVPGVTDAVEVAIGGGYGQVLSGFHWGGRPFRCFRRAGGTVECAGANDLGQLGDGTMDYGSGGKTTSRETFAPVVGLTDAVQISAGTGNFACARRATGAVVCWGGNRYGNTLGNGTSVFASPTPGPVVGLTDAIDVSVGMWGACAIRAGGQVVCWGQDEATGLDNSVPVPVAGMTDAVAIAKGFDFAFAIRADGSVWGWGRRGPWLGDGVSTFGSCTSGRCFQPPSPVIGIASATKISASGIQPLTPNAGGCALRPTGVVSCWGLGALGDGVTTSSNVPVDVLGINDALAVSRNGGSACAIRSGGRVSCWGKAPVDLPW